MTAVICRGSEVYCKLDGESIVENCGESMWDELYEDALDGWCEKVPRAAYDDLSQRLTAVLHAWLKEQGERASWTVIETVAEPKQ